MTFAEAWARERGRVDAHLEELLAKEPAEARDVLAAALDGGKRLRPALLLLVHEAHGGAGPERAERWAAGLEFIHAATLIHDDLLDGDAVRRGRPALHARLGPRLAVLAGDAAVAWGVALLEEPEAARGARDALREAWLAAWREARGQRGEEVSRGKTAGLFRLACALGARGARAPEEAVAAAASYGEALGLAYQAADDAADEGARASEAHRHAALARRLAADFPPGPAREALAEAPDAVVAMSLAPLAGGAAP